MSVTTKTIQYSLLITLCDRCHAFLEASVLFLRSSVYFLEILVNPWLLNETGVYLGEASIQAQTV